MIRTAILFLIAANLFASRADRYALVLEDPPIAALPSSKTRAAPAAHVERIRGAQNSLREALSERGIRVLGSAQTLVNAVFVAATPDEAGALRQLPGVARVQRLHIFKRHLNRAVGLVNAPQGWNALGGAQNAGLGIKIAILDTGIDQNHAAFQDPSLQMPAGYPKCAGDDCKFTSNKVIAARSYVQMLASYLGSTDPRDSRPDDLSMRDRVGHGTAAASAAAGVEHGAPLARISGVAPKAYLGSYKIFGSPGVNDLTLEEVVINALEDAYNDDMDVASLSLGTAPDWGFNDSGATCQNATGVPCLLFASAVETASQKMAVVVSAGNDGDAGLKVPSLNTIANPGIAPSAITVGATTNSHVLYASVRMGGSAPSSLQRMDALVGDGARPLGPVGGPVVDVSKTGNDGTACSPLGSGTLAGALGLIQRGTCGYAVKVNNAQAAGAIGVILYQATGSNFVYAPTGLGGTGIPAVLIGYDNGVALKNYLASNPNAPGTLDPALVERDASYDTVAYFSSQGPTIGDSFIKPELVAVGTDLYMATQKFDPNGDMYDPSGYVAAQGTSFSAPMVAGAVALAIERNPTVYSPAQLKSLVVNTAGNVVNDVAGAAKASVKAVGAGKLNVAAALASPLTVAPSTLSFGNAGTVLPSPITLTVTNISGQAVQATLNVSPSDPRLTLSPASLSLAPGQATQVTARLAGSLPGPGSYEGAVVIQAGATSLRVPYLYLVGNGVMDNLVPVKNYDFVALAGQRTPSLLFKAVDQYGMPVANLPVRFTPALGAALDSNSPCPQRQGVYRASATTDSYGIGYAYACMGPLLGEQAFNAQVGTSNPMTLTFVGRAIQTPTIQSGGVLNAAGGRIDKGLAPGSYISIYGAGLSESTRVEVTESLPIALAGISVSFDVPERGLSLPGHLHFVSPGQVNVQIPWEFEGLNNVQVKVSNGWDFQTPVYTVPLAKYSPGVFEYADPSSGRLLASVLDENYGLVSGANPARKGRPIQIFCNGLGPVDNRPASGEPSPVQPLATTRVPASVTVGGRPAQFGFSGLAPNLVGLYQVNVTVPADAPSGIQPLVVTMEGNDSKTVNLPIQ